MASSSSRRTLPPSWKFALIGAIASLPVVAVLNWLPDWIGEADIGGGIMILGAFIAGFIATMRSSDPSAAGLRAGFIGALVESAVFAVTAGVTATWSLSRVVFFVFAGALLLILAPAFGFVLGRLGGWTATIVTPQQPQGADTSSQ